MSTREKWGEQGYEDARRWPKLPYGTLIAGDVIPRIDTRQVMIALLSIPPPINLPVEEPDPQPSGPDSLLYQDIIFALELGDKPEEELTRYERRRMRRLKAAIDRLQRKLKPNNFSCNSSN
jgi:hypothetical protein